MTQCVSALWHVSGGGGLGDGDNGDGGGGKGSRGSSTPSMHHEMMGQQFDSHWPAGKQCLSPLAHSRQRLSPAWQVSVLLLIGGGGLGGGGKNGGGGVCGDGGGQEGGGPGGGCPGAIFP
eukprot:4617435-Prymnesium_polylepis.2